MSAQADLDQLAINTIRTLSIDAVQQANSGHPGTPMAMAPVVYTLWQNHLRFDPQHPVWPNRDRFVLSVGHASMLLYSMLYLSKVQAVDGRYETLGKPSVTLDDIKRFRQSDSKCPGHPEYRFTSGVETTTGPLGQGVATSVGMAIGEYWLADHFNRPGHTIFDHRIYALCGDGDMMEGISNEAASLAGHLKLANLCWIYDSNRVTIEGHTDIAFSDDVAMRYEAYGWRVDRVLDANDTKSLDAAIERFKSTTDRPTMIIVNSHIGYGSPHKQDSSAAHGEPLGEDEVKLVKRAYGWPEDAKFLVPDGVMEHIQGGLGERGARFSAEWREKLIAYEAEFPALADALQQLLHRDVPEGWDKDLPVFPTDAKGVSGRDASAKVLNAIAPNYPWLIGGSADLAPSTKTRLTFEGAGDFTSAQTPGRNFHFGIREHAMAAALNGMALQKVRPFGSGFMIFSDYLKPSLRLSSLMELPVIYIFTHDSIGVGEDGPTHQPVEQLATLRATPGLITMRPADGNEVIECWRIIAHQKHQPTVLVLSRQPLPTLDRSRYAAAGGAARGAYILADPPDGTRPAVIMMATGSEVALCIGAYEKLAEEGIPARVVSMPSWELFEQQPVTYRESVLPPDIIARLSVEEASTFGWERYTGLRGARIGMTTFGSSAPLKDLLTKFGFTPDKVLTAAKDQIARAKETTR
jgi:transketolase